MYNPALGWSGSAAKGNNKVRKHKMIFINNNFIVYAPIWHWSVAWLRDDSSDSAEQRQGSTMRSCFRAINKTWFSSYHWSVMHNLVVWYNLISSGGQSFFSLWAQFHGWCCPSGESGSAWFQAQILWLFVGDILIYYVLVYNFIRYLDILYINIMSVGLFTSIPCR